VVFIESKTETCASKRKRERKKERESEWEWCAHLRGSRLNDIETGFQATKTRLSKNNFWMSKKDRNPFMTIEKNKTGFVFFRPISLLHFHPPHKVWDAVFNIWIEQKIVSILS
jgi:hypothetical protein